MNKVSYKGNFKKLSPELHKAIAKLYASGDFTVEYLAKTYNVSVRQIQRVAKAQGVIRTQAEANRVAAPLKHYHTIPLEFRVQRKQISQKLRYQLISQHPYCTTCGMRPDQGIRLEVDHKDNDATNNDLSNLQVLCAPCNRGKSDLDRFK